MCAYRSGTYSTYRTDLVRHLCLWLIKLSLRKSHLLLLLYCHHVILIQNEWNLERNKTCCNQVNPILQIKYQFETYEDSTWVMYHVFGMLKRQKNSYDDLKEKWRFWSKIRIYCAIQNTSYFLGMKQHTKRSKMYSYSLSLLFMLLSSWKSIHTVDMYKKERLYNFRIWIQKGNMSFCDCNKRIRLDRIDWLVWNIMVSMHT